MLGLVIAAQGHQLLNVVAIFFAELTPDCELGLLLGYHLLQLLSCCTHASDRCPATPCQPLKGCLFVRRSECGTETCPAYRS